MRVLCVGQYSLAFALSLAAAEFHVPAGDRYPVASAAGAILPGGRVLKPYGKELETGPGTGALAVGPKGLIASADTGPERFGVTLIEPPVKGVWRTHHVWARTPDSRAPETADPEWKSVAAGLAFESEHALWVSEGPSGRIRLIDPQNGERRKLVSLSNPPSPPGRSGDLAIDSARRLLYALDREAARLVVIDTRSGRVRSGLALDQEPAAIALSEDSQTAWITFAPQGDSIAVIDISDPARPLRLDVVRTGGHPSNLIAANGRIFASDPQDDSVLILSPVTRQVTARIPLRIQQLEELRGISPAGLAFDPVTNWLLVAEPGINAVGVVDVAAGKLIGHIPAGWMPVSVAISGDRVYVANRNGHGTGPNLRLPLLDLGETPALHHGTVTTFVVPAASELTALTATVFASNGFTPDARAEPPVPVLAGHVVLIAAEGRSFDEVLGDVIQVGPTRVASFAPFARFGLHGLANGVSGQFSIHDAAVTPNLHRIAQLWASSDNYHAEAEAPMAEDVAPLLSHIKSKGVRAASYESTIRFLDDLERFARPGVTNLPSFIYITLPRPSLLSGRLPYEASFAADTDLNIGHILEGISHSRWWNDTVVLIVAAGASRGLDHIDSHRTPMLAAGPLVRRTYLSRTNASFPAVTRAALELLHLPPLGLRDATAPSLREIFTGIGKNDTFTALPPDARLFQIQ
jgi:DNA-binding beta-propeller fold protein YncE